MKLGIILIILLGLFDFGLAVACHHMEDKDMYEVSERRNRDDRATIPR